MNYQKHLIEDRRLVILRVLKEMPQHSANDSMLHDLVIKWGNICTRDQVKTEISWLHDQGFLLREETAGIVIAEITQRGMDVAKGLTTVDGIRKPSPRY